MKYLSSLFIIFAVLILPDQAVAQGMGIVPCEGPECTACHMVDLANEVIQWLIAVLMVIFAIIVAIAGFELVTSGGNPEAKTKAKSKMTNAFIGLIIVLSAWLMVDTLMRTILSGGSGEIEGRLWSEIVCLDQNIAEEGDNYTATTTATGLSEAEQALIDSVAAGCNSLTNGVRLTAAPTANLCNASTEPSEISPVVDEPEGDPSVDPQVAGPWSWNCGLSSCKAYFDDGSTPVDNTGNGCGSEVDLDFVGSKPTTNMCVIDGTESWTDGEDDPRAGDHFIWYCGGVHLCKVKYDPTGSISPSCGTADGVEVSSRPTNDTCVGPSDVRATFSDTTGDDGHFDWECTSDINSDTDTCSAPRVPLNECAAGYDGSDDAHAASVPSTKCAVGTYSNDVDQDSTDNVYDWTCKGGAAGNTAFCRVTIVRASCGSAEWSCPTSMPIGNLCNDETRVQATDNQANDGDYNWDCHDSVGRGASCSADTIGYGACR